MPKDSDSLSASQSSEHSSSKENLKRSNKPFLDHLEELRFRIIKVISSLIIFGIVGYLYREEILVLVLSPLRDIGNLEEIRFIHLKVHDKFMAYLKLSFYTSLILSFPVLLYQISRFVLPALYLREYRFYFVSMGLIIVLFFWVAF